MDVTSKLCWFFMVTFVTSDGATDTLKPGMISREADLQQDALLRRDLSMPQRASIAGEETLENLGPFALIEEDSISNDNSNYQASDPSESAGLSQELKALESTQQMKEALESSILRDMAKAPRTSQKDEAQKKADEGAQATRSKEKLTKSIEEDIMNKLEINNPNGAYPSSAAEVTDAAGIYESQLGILQALKQRLTSSGRVIKEAADAEESKITDRVLKTMDEKLAREQPIIVSSVLEQGQKDLAKELATAIQKNRDDEMKILKSSIADIREEARQAESTYRAHTQEDIRESMMHFGSNITSLLQGFIRQEHEESVKQKDRREDNDYEDSDDDDDDNGYSNDDDDYDDDRQSSKRKSDRSQVSSPQQPLAHPVVYSKPYTEYEVPGTSSTQSEPMQRMQGREARAAYRRYPSDNFEADALAQADETEAKALGRNLPAKEERLRVASAGPALTQNLDLGEPKASRQAYTRTDDDFGLKEAEDAVSKEVLSTLSEQKVWPGTDRQQRHFHRHRHHHQDDYDDDDY